VAPAPATTSTVDDRTELGDGAERGTGAGQVGGADLAQQDVEGERHQHRERDGDQQRRDHRNPAIIQV
jgi:hypothetical protein